MDWNTCWGHLQSSRVWVGNGAVEKSPDFVPTLLLVVAFNSDLLEWQMCADEFRMLNFNPVIRSISEKTSEKNPRKKKDNQKKSRKNKAFEKKKDTQKKKTPEKKNRKKKEKKDTQKKKTPEKKDNQEKRHPRKKTTTHPVVNV